MRIYPRKKMMMPLIKQWDFIKRWKWNDWKLEIEVTKAKEKLENYLSQANNEIRLNEKMKKE